MLFQSRKFFVYSILALSASTMLAGCAARPSLRPVEIRSLGDVLDDQFESYALQESVVTFQATPAGEGANRKTNVTGTYARREHPNLRIGLRASDPLGVRTGITITRIENTDLPSEIAVKVEDNRVALINQAGGFLAQIVGGVVGFAGNDPSAPLPLEINLSRDIPANGEFAHPNGWYRVNWGPLAPDAIPVGQLNAQPAGSWFYYAACRDARVQFNYHDPIRNQDQNYSFSYRVSDPSHLQRVHMPAEGKITMHSQCGASVTGRMSNDDSTATLSIASAILTQALALKEAAEAEDR